MPVIMIVIILYHTLKKHAIYYYLFLKLPLAAKLPELFGIRRNRHQQSDKTGKQNRRRKEFHAGADHRPSVTVIHQVVIYHHASQENGTGQKRRRYNRKNNVIPASAGVFTYQRVNVGVDFKIAPIGFANRVNSGTCVYINFTDIVYDNCNFISFLIIQYVI